MAARFGQLRWCLRRVVAESFSCTTVGDHVACQLPSAFSRGTVVAYFQPS